MSPAKRRLRQLLEQAGVDQRLITLLTHPNVVIEDPDWSQVTEVLGRRQRLTATACQRPCARCGHPTFTSRPYPDDVRVICTVCFREELANEGGGR